MPDTPRLLGRVAGSTSGHAWSITAHDDAPEPERVDKGFEAKLAAQAQASNRAARERNGLEREVESLERRIRQAKARGRDSTVRILERNLERAERRRNATEAKVDRLRSERGGSQLPRSERRR